MNQNPVIRIYHLMRRSRVTFKAIIRLKEFGVNKWIKDVIGLNSEVTCSEAEMREAREFIRKNRNRIYHMLDLLEDDKSRRVWKAVMLYRAKGRAIPKQMWSDNDQYFVREIIHIGQDEVFIDGGAFVGDSIQHLLNFAKRDGGSIRKVIAFEPDKSNIVNLKSNFAKNKKILIIEKGLSDRKKILSFLSNGSSSYFLQGEEQTNLENILQIQCTSIDEMPECHDATFIKMDIEGAEMEALIGGAGTIGKNLPKLAICIYHSLEDMVRIAEYLHENYPRYKLYIRQHTANHAETVLYAVT